MNRKPARKACCGGAAAVAFVAGWLPGRRTAGIDPAVAVRLVTTEAIEEVSRRVNQSTETVSDI
jgi:hypothetical protein